MTFDITFAVRGMSCVSCSRAVEESLGRLPEVKYVSVNLGGGKVYAVTEGEPIWENLAAAVSAAGYTPLEEPPGEDEEAAMFQAALRRTLLAWAAALPAAVLMILHMSGMHIPWLTGAEILAGFAVLLGPGRHILKGAWTAVSHRHANMDVLVSLGTIAAWTTALLAFFHFPIWSFGAMAPLLPAFHLSGRLLEERLRHRAGADLRALTSPEGGKVNLIKNGELIAVPLESVEVGMRIHIRTGERIPLDGRVISGGGGVSEAMISGEPLPVAKSVGSEVTGGTVLESGLLEVEVTRTGEDLFLSRMIALVEQAQGVQIPLQALADKISGIFVPVILCLACVSFGSWLLFYKYLQPLLMWAVLILPWIPADAGPWTIAVFAMVAMLVVACPCALGLATPMAVSVGSGLAARRGLLIKGGEALQTSGELDVLIFDKTGTLTVGRPSVVFSSLSDPDRQAAAALEAHSIHPLARAIAGWAQSFPGSEKDLPKVENVSETAGEGISGLVNGVPYTVGRPNSGTESSGTRVEVTRNGLPAGHILLKDAVKPEAAAAVAALLKQGVRPIMATGDGEGAARETARLVGIPENDVRFSLKPEDKLRLVQSFQQQGLRTGMTGDGINDAAALKASDVGFALAQGTDLSMEAGDVIITRGGLEKIVLALKLSKLMARKIRGNLIWAFGYNIVALPAAALGLIHPLVAEAAMSVSSLGVVLNSLGIRRGKGARKE
ncbi:MAG: hypothetical protein B0D92_03475 [Spirochaeta sp. LUC14_002_19_P3]|nr:MAG: hypothetical protein B0D92_03475 [Spirochaeta sp. LUC14_002_19_P3]